MLSFLTDRFFARDTRTNLQGIPGTLADAAVQAFSEGLAVARQQLEEVEESTILRTLGWVTAGLGAVALGLFVGRELRQRYEFNRRTPYDFYAHSGDELHEVEFGVGI